MEKAFHTVCEHVGDKQEQQKEFYDQKCHGKPFWCISTPMLCPEDKPRNYIIPGLDLGEY